MQEWLSKNNTNKIRAIVAIGIAYTHLCIFTSNPNLTVFGEIGYLCVGVFYFYVGYNCIYSFKNNGLKNYIIKKIKRIYIPYVVANILYVLIERFLNYMFFSKREMLKFFLGIKLVNTTLWYVSSVILFYSIFYIVFQGLLFLRKKSNFRKLFESRIAMLSFFLFGFALYTLVFPYMAKINDFIPDNNCHYPFSLLIGGVFALFYEEIYKGVRKYKFQLLVIFITLLLIIHPLNMNSKQLNVFGINIFNSIPPIMAALIMNIYVCDEHINGRVLDYIGNISYEIYLLHFVILVFYKNWTINISNDYLWVALYTITLFIAASILHFSYRYICSKISSIKERLKGKKSEKS